MIRAPRIALFTAAAAALFGRISAAPSRIVSMADRVGVETALTLPSPVARGKFRDTRSPFRIATRRAKAKVGQRTRLANARRARG